MSERSRYLWWYGRDEAPPETVAVRAGPLTALLDGVDLRYLRVGDVEVLRRLYVAVRDHNWDTVPGVVTNLRRDLARDRFSVEFDAAHSRRDIDFSWHGRIEGAPDGTISCRMDGRAGGAFRYNRIGFCLLHPPAECAGRPYRGRAPGGEIAGTLPELIGPQRIEGGTIRPLFPSVEWLEIDLAGGVRARFAFEGDLFEMEDQRNWTDASYKTYCTPLALPWPRDARPGQMIAQAVTITAEAAATATDLHGTGAVAVRVGEGSGRAMPPIGLGMAEHGRALSARERRVLGALRPSHLRADLGLDEPGYVAVLEGAIAAARALGCALELAITLSGEAEERLADLAARLPTPVPLARVLVFHRAQPVTGGRWVRLARERLGAAAPGVPFAGGTNAYFTDLNRDRPEIAALDAVAYSINPQVHAFDETSLVETMAAQADTVRSARAFCGDVPIVVGPITLRPRFNPNATGPEPEPGPGELPPSVDPRQMSLFGAAWTLGSIKYLAEGGAASLTYYETTGWRGVLEGENGPPPGLPFPSHPGMVFPLYHVLADAAAWRGADLLVCASADPLRVDGLAVRAPDGVHVILANATPAEQTVALSLPASARAAIRALDERSAAFACDEPERFRSERRPLEARAGKFILTLPPYAVVRIDAE